MVKVMYGFFGVAKLYADSMVVVIVINVC